MDVRDLPSRLENQAGNPSLPGRLVGLQGRLARPFWGLMGIWATLCGALASGRLSRDGDGLLTLVLVILLTDLGWGSLWELVAGTDWRRILVSLHPAHSSVILTLPFTQPGAPAERFFRQIGRVRGWWRGALWPAAGPVLLGILAAGVLVAVLTWLLPERIRPLNLVLVAVFGLGLIQRWRGREPLAGEALAQVGLGWLAGHAAFSGLGWTSVVLAWCFAIAAWGALRADEGRPGSLWLLDGGQGAAGLLLVVLKQPLAAGAVGLLLFGQVALQPVLRLGGTRAGVVRRSWPWLMATMLAAASAIP